MQGWTTTGTLSTERAAHTATLLYDHTVLVHGGQRGSGRLPEDPIVQLETAELYHPHSGTWTPTGSTFYPRSGHTASLLPSGKVIAVGGIVGGRAGSTTTELYDPATREWYSTGTLNAPRGSQHAVSGMSDGKVLVMGGNESPNTAELYDPITQVWTLTGSLNYGRYGHTATLLTDGTVLVLGGVGDDAATENTAEVYDPVAGKWTLIASPFYPRFGHTATRLQDGKVLVVGGVTDITNEYALDAVEIYDPATGNWYAAGKLKEGRYYQSAALLPTGQVLVVGTKADSDHIET